MAEESAKQDLDKSGGETKHEDFSADEIARESIYDDSTYVAQQMKQGEQAKGDPNDLPTGASAEREKNQSGK